MIWIKIYEYSSIEVSEFRALPLAGLQSASLSTLPSFCCELQGPTPFKLELAKQFDGTTSRGLYNLSSAGHSELECCYLLRERTLTRS